MLGRKTSSYDVSDMSGVHPSEHPNCIFYMDWENDGADAQDQGAQKLGGLEVVSGSLKVANGSITGKQGLQVAGGDELTLTGIIGNLDPAIHAVFMEVEDIDATGTSTIEIEWAGSTSDLFGLTNVVNFLVSSPGGMNIITPLLHTVWAAVGSHQEGNNDEGPLGEYASHSDGTINSYKGQWDRMRGSRS